ncbi:hypothetical protein [Deltalipothrixvirus pozzuoliense]|uniref:Putative transmembrane protein ORF159 n=1 Tax=Acidianus filamentous virus 2 (isolate Italy/Pozzuoli) TaxID=654910 RepID=Y159_AFV2P|nr:hypothetical protein AFV2_gp29 [Acidianus filamentous virus 2]Q573E0.1 RecName: Full=Putative transmembrane protein ORF159 [Acidianus filamentous virus 2 (isolate Pozzuoli)]CAH69416.1 hypothetical protein [Acidianus filamentous virus 2]
MTTPLCYSSPVNTPLSPSLLLLSLLLLLSTICGVLPLSLFCCGIGTGITLFNFDDTSDIIAVDIASAICFIIFCNGFCCCCCSGDPPYASSTTSLAICDGMLSLLRGDPPPVAVTYAPIFIAFCMHNSMSLIESKSGLTAFLTRVTMTSSMLPFSSIIS